MILKFGLNVNSSAQLPSRGRSPQSSGHVIPALIRKFVQAKDDGRNEVVVWGSGKAIREFLYVDDAARAIAMATKSYDEGHPVNIGTGSGITIADLVEKIRSMVGYEGQIIWDTSKPDGQPRRCLDTTRARERFGFRAHMDLDEGLRRTIDWWAEHKAKAH